MTDLFGNPAAMVESYEVRIQAVADDPNYTELRVSIRWRHVRPGNVRAVIHTAMLPEALSELVYLMGAANGAWGQTHKWHRERLKKRLETYGD